MAEVTNEFRKRADWHRPCIDQYLLSKGGDVSLGLIKRLTVTVLLGVLTFTFGVAAFQALPAFAQEELSRKVKSKVAPAYPEIARRMAISGTVKLAVVVSPNGSIKDAKILGGHPVLVNAALDAIKKWKFEPAAEETSGTVEFKFSPQE
jgi:TonB family protein